MKLFRITILPLLLLLAGCKVDIDRNVLFIGDSLIEQSFPEISRELLLADDHGYFLMTNAIGGSAFSRAERGGPYYRVRAVQILEKHRVDIVVISFGANDTYLNAEYPTRPTPEEMLTAAGALMDAYAGKPIIWILPHDRVREIYGTGVYSEVISVITEAASTRPNVKLVDFTAFITGRGLTMADVCLPNDMHFSRDGAYLFAKMIHAELSAH